MKKVFEFMSRNGAIIPFIFLLIILLGSCTTSKDMCAAYAYNEIQKDKNKHLNH